MFNVFLFVLLSIPCILIALIVKLFSSKIDDKIYYNIHKPKQSAIISLISVVLSICFVILVFKYLITFLISKNIYFDVTIIPQTFFIVIALITIAIRKESLTSIGITKNNLLISIISGLVFSIAYLIINLFLKDIFSTSLLSIFSIKHIKMQFLSVLHTFHNNINKNLIYILVGFSEELLFRGLLQTRLMLWLGDKKGWIITAFMFAFFHIPVRMIVSGYNFISAVFNVIYLIPVALLLGFIMKKYKNVAASSILHTFVDCIDI